MEISPTLAHPYLHLRSQSIPTRATASHISYIHTIPVTHVFCCIIPVGSVPVLFRDHESSKALEYRTHTFVVCRKETTVGLQCRTSFNAANKHTDTHTRIILTAIFPSKPGLASCPLTVNEDNVIRRTVLRITTWVICRTILRITTWVKCRTVT